MRALIIGAGIGGLTAARALDRRGIAAVVFEKASDIAAVQLGGAIHIWHNGMRGLDRIGLGDAVQALGGRGAVVDRAEMRNCRGRLITSWSVKDTEREVGAPTVGVRRPDLHRVLMDGVEQGVIQLGRECTGFSQDGDGVVARFADGSEERGDVLIGADGLRSAVRQQLHGPEDLKYAGYASWQGLARFKDEAAPVGLFRVVWGPGARFLFYHVDDETLYWEGIYATPAGVKDPPGGRRAAVLERFAGWDHPVVVAIEATREEDITRGDVYVRDALKRWGEGRVTLLGDAAHPMTNAVGQGANQTIEDSVVLARCLSEDGADVAAGLQAYEAERRPRATRMAGLAWTLSGFSKWDNPAAVRLRDPLLTTMFALVGKRAQRKDAAYAF